jgi:hypothetical protein
VDSRHRLWRGFRGNDISKPGDENRVIASDRRERGNLLKDCFATLAMTQDDYLQNGNYIRLDIKTLVMLIGYVISQSGYYCRMEMNIIHSVIISILTNGRHQES